MGFDRIEEAAKLRHRRYAEFSRLLIIFPFVEKAESQRSSPLSL